MDSSLWKLNQKNIGEDQTVPNCIRPFFAKAIATCLGKNSTCLDVFFLRFSRMGNGTWNVCGKCSKSLLYFLVQLVGFS